MNEDVLITRACEIISNIMRHYPNEFVIVRLALEFAKSKGIIGSDLDPYIKYRIGSVINPLIEARIRTLTFLWSGVLDTKDYDILKVLFIQRILLSYRDNSSSNKSFKQFIKDVSTKFDLKNW